MDSNNALWGVTALSITEQRAIRGGALNGGSRAECIRNATRNYVTNIRNNMPRDLARSSLLSEIEACSGEKPR